MCAERVACGIRWASKFHQESSDEPCGASAHHSAGGPHWVKILQKQIICVMRFVAAVNGSNMKQLGAERRNIRSISSDFLGGMGPRLSDLFRQQLVGAPCRVTLALHGRLGCGHAVDFHLWKPSWELVYHSNIYCTQIDRRVKTPKQILVAHLRTVLFV